MLLKCVSSPRTIGINDWRQPRSPGRQCNGVLSALPSAEPCPPLRRQDIKTSRVSRHHHESLIFTHRLERTILLQQHQNRNRLPGKTCQDLSSPLKSLAYGRFSGSPPRTAAMGNSHILIDGSAPAGMPMASPKGTQKPILKQSSAVLP